MQSKWLLNGCLLLFMFGASLYGCKNEAAAQETGKDSFFSAVLNEIASKEKPIVTEPAESNEMESAEQAAALTEDITGTQYCEDDLFRFRIPEGSFQPKLTTGICMKPSDEYQMNLREAGAANGLEEIAEQDIERMMKYGYNYLGWIDDGRNGFKLVYDVEINSAAEGAEVLYQEAVKSGFHDSENPEPYSVTRMETSIGGYQAHIVRQIGDTEIMGSQENYVALIDAPTGEVVRFNYYIVDQATREGVNEIFGSFEFK